MPRGVLATLASALALFLSAPGCVRSVNRFYADSDVVHEPALETAWAGGDGTATLARAPHGHGYVLRNSTQSDEPRTRTRIVLFRLGRHYLFDCETPGDDGTFHSLYKAVPSGDSLLLVAVDEHQLRQTLRANPGALEYHASQPAPTPRPAPRSEPRPAKDARDYNGLTLTDSADNVRRFVSDHADELFGAAMWPMVATGDLPLADGDGLFSRRQRTIDHWFVLSTVIRQRCDEPVRQKVLDHLQQAQKQLAALSDLGVDPDAARARRDLQALYAAAEQFLSDDQSPPQAVDQFLHEMAGFSLPDALRRLDPGNPLRLRLDQLRPTLPPRQQRLARQFGPNFPPLLP